MNKELKETFKRGYDYNQLVVSTRGFAFDSLVFRFKDYQARTFQSEVNDYKYNYKVSEVEARQRVKNMHNRDLIRFIEILDSVIGEHD